MTRWEYASTGDEVVAAFKDRVRDKIIVITGPSQGGIGAETAITIAAGLPSLLVLTARSESKIAPVITTITARYPSVSVKFVQLDLSSQKSIRKAAAEINSIVTEIDILICNAAIMASPFETSEDGIEMQFATNYLGHFLLTNLLMGKVLKAERGMRIVNVSSWGHAFGPVRFDDINFQDGKVYDAWEAYGQSKSAIILGARALASSLEKYGGFAFSLHPGSIKTNLQTHMLASDSLHEIAMNRVKALAAAPGGTFKFEEQKTLQQGCATTLIAALDLELESQNGQYLHNGDVATVAVPADGCTSLENQKLLWRLSEELVGEKFDW